MHDAPERIFFISEQMSSVLPISPVVKNQCVLEATHLKQGISAERQGLIKLTNNYIICTIFDQ